MTRIRVFTGGVSYIRVAGDVIAGNDGVVARGWVRVACVARNKIAVACVIDKE